ncbi:MAG: hypothetical protein H3C30_11695 [Candidatus Hydrogenedentes bacterium]|nr:hypothetical protein [Candidatus Hydrogenedentota bacterium]
MKNHIDMVYDYMEHECDGRSKYSLVTASTSELKVGDIILAPDWPKCERCWRVHVLKCRIISYGVIDCDGKYQVICEDMGSSLPRNYFMERNGEYCGYCAQVLNFLSEKIVEVPIDELIPCALLVDKKELKELRGTYFLIGIRIDTH